MSVGAFLLLSLDTSQKRAASHETALVIKELCGHLTVMLNCGVSPTALASGTTVTL